MKINPSDPSSVPLFHWECITCHGSKHTNAYAPQHIYKNKPSVPCSRFHHAACSQGKFLYILGGKDRCSPLKDFWRLDLASEQWDEIDGKKIALPHLEGHTMLSYKSELLIFGGTFCDSGDDTPLWIFNTDLFCVRKWCEPNSPQPIGRREHSAVIYKNSMYIYGGFLDNSGSTDEFWLFNIEEVVWQQIPRSQPGKRHGHVAVVTNNNMWLHGGMKELVALSDLWIYNFNLCTWTKIKGQGASPTLANHTGHVFDKWLILLGGTRSGQPLYNIWLFRLDTQTWTQILAQGEAICPPLSLHASVLLKASIVKSQHVDQVKSLPQLTSTATPNPCDSVRPHTAFSKSENFSDVHDLFLLPSLNRKDLPRLHRIETAEHSSHRKADILHLNVRNCESEKISEQLDEETSFSHEPINNELLRKCTRPTKSSVEGKTSEINSRPASGELVHDSLPLLQRFHSVTSNEDLGLHNLSVTISDEQVNVSTQLPACSLKSNPVNNTVNRTSLNEINKRKAKIDNKHQAKTSLIKKVYKQKASKTHPIKDKNLATKNGKATNENKAYNFENPVYSVFYDESKTTRTVLSETLSSKTSDQHQYYQKVSPKYKDDLLIEDLEWLDKDQLFSAYYAILPPVASRTRSTSFTDLSNYALNVSDFKTNSVASFKVSRQNSKSCDDLISKSSQKFFSLNGSDKELFFSNNDVLTVKANADCDSTELKCRKESRRNLMDSKDCFSTSTSRTFHNKLYILQNSIGIQTSDSLLMLDKPRAQTVNSVFNPVLIDESLALSNAANNLVDAPEPHMPGILGDSEVCILVLGGQSEHISFKSEPMKLWKCPLS